MKNLKNSHKTLFAVALATFALGFTACSNDDNDIPNENDLALETEMGLFGTYAGDFELINPSALAQPKTDGDNPVPEAQKVKLVVSKDHTMAMDAYPIIELINELYEDPKEANDILVELGNISPKMTFETKQISQEKGLISFSINADDVKIELKSGDVIVFDFDNNDQLGKFNNEEACKIDFTVVAKAQLYVKAITKTDDVAPTKVSTKIHKFNFEKLTK